MWISDLSKNEQKQKVVSCGTSSVKEIASAQLGASLRKSASGQSGVKSHLPQCKFSEGNSFKYDAINPDNGIQEGMSCLWGMRYQVTPDGPTINDCGLVFLQTCSSSSRNTKAPFLAAKFREFLGKITETHLLNSAAASSGPSASSGSTGFPVPRSPKQVKDGQQQSTAQQQSV